MLLNVNELQIIRYPDPRLKKPSAAVTAIDAEVRQIAARMIDLMHDAKGVGLAASLIGGVAQMCAELGEGVWEVDGVTYTCG